MKCPGCGNEVEPVNGACPDCGAATGGREITAKIDTEELRRKWEERAEKARGVAVVASVGAKTDLGRVRENNEDKFEFYVPEDEDTLARKGAFYAVADGMGGHAAGQIASELALKTVIGQYYDDDSASIDGSLRSAVQAANAVIHGAAQAIVERNGMGTTMTALVIRGEEVFVAQVGDSRCYRLRGGKLEQLTEDHSWVNEQVRRGGMTREEAENSPFRNIITRSLGNFPTVEPDIFQEELHEGDVFVLCSDGLTGEVSDEDIRRALHDAAPSKAAWDLVGLALQHGGKDNVTVLIVAVRDIIRRERKRKGLAGLLARD
jgi:protein phosphatase